MSRPEVTLQNYKAVYEWYRERGQNPRFAAFGHKAVAWAHKPEVTESPRVERTIGALFATGTRFVLLANHIDARDVTVLPAVAWAYKPLRPIVGNARIVAKQEMFNGQFLGNSMPVPARKLGGGLMRVTGDALGMIPALRGSSNQDEDRELLKAAHSELASTEGYFLDKGIHIAKFGEGKRNFEDPKTVQEQKQGVKYGLEAASEGVHLAALPVGVWYPEDGHVRTHIGEPIMSPLARSDVLGDIRDRLQHCVDVARGAVAA